MRKRYSRRLSNLSLVCFGLALLFSAACAATAGAQGSAPALRKQGAEQQQRRQQSARDDDDDDDANDEAAGPRAADPAAVLRRARLVFVRSDTAFVSGREVEASLLKRKEFKAWGMGITRDEARADLVIEITRKPLTRRFTFSVIDPRTSEVVASGKTRSVLFGKKISNKVAEKFANRVKVYRPYP
jgi:hypothetical protein